MNVENLQINPILFHLLEETFKGRNGYQDHLPKISEIEKEVLIKKLKSKSSKERKIACVLMLYLAYLDEKLLDMFTRLGYIKTFETNNMVTVKRTKDQNTINYEMLLRIIKNNESDSSLFNFKNESANKNKRFYLKILKKNNPRKVEILTLTEIIHFFRARNYKIFPDPLKSIIWFKKVNEEMDFKEEIKKDSLTKPEMVLENNVINKRSFSLKKRNVRQTGKEIRSFSLSYNNKKRKTFEKRVKSIMKKEGIAYKRKNFTIKKVEKGFIFDFSGRKKRVKDDGSKRLKSSIFDRELKYKPLFIDNANNSQKKIFSSIEKDNQMINLRFENSKYLPVLIKQKNH